MEILFYIFATIIYFLSVLQ